MLAGGQSLIPMLALRLAVLRPPRRHRAHRRAAGHRAARRRPLDRRRHDPGRVEADAEVAAAVPLLAEATPFIGHFQIRNRGTLGGSIAHADPAAEYPAVALALDASMEVVSPPGRRTIAARDFFDGLWSTSMEPDELARRRVVPDLGRAVRVRGRGVRAPARRLRDRGRHDRRRARRRRPDPALRDRPDRPGVDARAGDGRGGRGHRAADRRRRSPRRSVGSPWPGSTSVPADLHGSAEYRTRVGAAMAARAWTTAGAEARDG